MQQITDHIDADYLQQAAPRPLAPTLMLEVLGNRLFERPLSAILHPLFVTSIAALLVLLALRLPAYFIILPLALVTGRLILASYRVWRRAWADLSLLRNGLVLRAHIMKLRPNCTLSGEINGALLDCAIAVAPRRTYVGSLWIADGNEALRLLHQGRLQVICLPQTPGTWRVVEPIRSDVRYDRVGPTVAIPTDA